MSEPVPLSETEEAELAAFADGQLDPERRAALERRMASEPALASAYERQRAGLVAISAAAAAVSAPLALRTRVRGDAAHRSRAAPVAPPTASRSGAGCRPRGSRPPPRSP